VALERNNDCHAGPPDKYGGTIETAALSGKSTGQSSGRSITTEAALRELLRTNDVVLVSAVGALLDGADIHHLVLDNNMSILEGSAGVIPRRILVHEDDNIDARRLLTEAGLAHELRDNERS
jgi:Putative prokaryotic signal transducing protein